MSLLAILPARGGSKRIPRKNIHPFLGRPMISWPVETARQSGLFDRIVVSTEDEEISRIAREAGAEPIARPPEMATDTAHELEACLQVLDALNARGEPDPDAFCVIYPTAVLIAPEDLAGGRALLDGPPEADVVFGVSGYPIHPYKALVKNEAGYLAPMFPVETKMRSQFYPHVTASNGTFYWLRTEAFRRLRAYYVERLAGYEIPAERAVDIDMPEDLARAEMIARLQNRAGRGK